MRHGHLNLQQIAYGGRAKAYQAWQNARSAWLLKKDVTERLRAAAKIRSDKIAVGMSETADVRYI
jgi:hypothetical protein